MNALIIYFTKTGHSRTIANAISKELQIKASDIKTNPKLSNVDLLFIVGGIYGGTSQAAMLEYIKGIDSNMVKTAALITSCASKKMKQDKVRDILLRNNIQVVPEEFICQGNFLFAGRGHPDNADIENAISYAKRILQVVPQNQ